MLNYTCPFCYEKFSKGQIEFRCENHNNNTCQESDAELAAYFGSSRMMANRVIPNKGIIEAVKSKSFLGTLKGLVRKVKVPTEISCDKCNKTSRKRVCPKCHNELPTFFHKADSHIISIIGARSSGKTHYITVLIHELLTLGYKLDISTVPQDVGEDRQQVTSKRYQRDYKNPLFEGKKELGQTQKNAQDHYPLIFQISSGQKGFNKTKALYLVFYDTAGENFNDHQELKKLANYVTNSSGMIFLLDTFQVNHIKNELQKKGVRVPQIGVEFNDVFHQLFALLQREGVVDGIHAKSKIPMALTFSKIDEVIKNNLLEDDFEDFTIRKESNYLNTSVYEREEMEEVSKDMRSLLNQWGEGQFIKDVETHFSNHCYFGVSALGSTPQGGMLREQIKPHRVLDPLLWILDSIGFALPKQK